MSHSLHARIEKRFAGGPGSQPFHLDVDFVAADGITVLFGPSGAGKTLTLEGIAGFARPDRGLIQFADRTLFDSQARIDLAARERRCGYLFQQDALFPHMTVRENVAFGAGAAESRIDLLLRDFRIAGLASRRPREISGGERQRCAIARTLASDPAFLLMDEPAQGLDLVLRRELHDVFRGIRDQFGLPMLLVTHDISEALSLADTLLLYSQGRIVQRGPARATFEQPASADAARLMGVAVLSGLVEESSSEQDSTVISVGELKIRSRFLADCAPGAAIDFCVHADAVRALPRNGDAPASCAVQLVAAYEDIDRVRLLFNGGLTANVPRPAYQAAAGALDWSVEFPAGSLSILT